MELAAIGLSNQPFNPTTEYFQVRIDLLIGTNCTIAFDDNLIPLRKELSLSVKERPVSPGDQASNINCIRLRLSRFPSHELAVEGGQRLVQSLLWCSISYRVSFQLIGNESLPFKIEPYGTSDGTQVSGFGHVYYNLTANDFRTALHDAFSSDATVSTRLQTAMDILARVRFERSQVAQFIQIVTSLEALAEQTKHDKNVGDALKIAAETLSSNEIFDQEVYAALKEPLVEAIKLLRRQGVIDAIKCLLESKGFTTEEVEFVKAQYKKRCEIPHEGKACDLIEAEMRKLENIVRRLIAVQLGLDLAREAE